MPKSTRDMAVVELEMPQFENGRPLLIAGLGGRYAVDTLDDLPALWELFSVHIGKLPGQVGRVANGVCSDMFTGTGSFHYLAGVDVSDSQDLLEELSLVHMTALRYAIFPHRKHVSTLRYTVNTIWTQWFPASKYKAARATDGAADFLERYGEHFNPQLGTGDIEVWIPLTA